MREIHTPSEGVNGDGKGETALQSIRRQHGYSTPSEGVWKMREIPTPSEGVRKGTEGSECT